MQNKIYQVRIQVKSLKTFNLTFHLFNTYKYFIVRRSNLWLSCNIVTSF